MKPNMNTSSKLERNKFLFFVVIFLVFWRAPLLFFDFDGIWAGLWILVSFFATRLIFKLFLKGEESKK